MNHYGVAFVAIASGIVGVCGLVSEHFALGFIFTLFALILGVPYFVAYERAREKREKEARGRYYDPDKDDPKY